MQPPLQAFATLPAAPVLWAWRLGLWLPCTAHCLEQHTATAKQWHWLLKLHTHLKLLPVLKVMGFIKADLAVMVIILCQWHCGFANVPAHVK